ncbi:zinc metalloprotease Rip1 [Paractinoplanes abujensis]|uniref:Membrane-associated protease RseP (Regulator of RpoE activity) n=1 Tax=Paractinoplanes abujensis TaxID=882441 RepID=A0A7W7CZ58_9ACTN|nr:site-2 protease family protein [Actinoplanes abujensis]MBB4697317.1 membrane-associated protease RseP (regulator of RpoE activity) [Actinoplanes abujensis]GID18207.1 zinc metalloprotease Rip1 [Actinoplanes abujensis]
MLYWLGVAAFALAILISVSLHELGHMLTAKGFGMKVSRYFVGFGPTIFSFQRGETEYGLKAIPLGGFCKIVGMTPQDDDVAPEDQPRAMWRFPVWKRTIVMSAGSITHFMLAAVAAYFAAISLGLPNTAYPQTDADTLAQKPVITITECTWVNLPTTQQECVPGQNGAIAGPAFAAGLRDGDLITRVGDTPITTYGQLTEAIRALPAGPVPVEYQRAGATATANVDLVAAQRAPITDSEGATTTVSVAGVGWDQRSVPTMIEYSAADGFGATADYGWFLFKNTFEAMKRIPDKIPALWHSITGAERDPETPISVVGASRLGGEALENGVPELFLNIFISLNVFIGIFNLLPLLPLDGGHIAIAWYERVRSWLYARFRKPDPGRVDYYKLMPVTYAVILIGGAFTLLTVTADIINPITIFK